MSKKIILDERKLLDLTVDGLTVEQIRMEFGGVSRCSVIRRRSEMRKRIIAEKQENQCPIAEVKKAEQPFINATIEEKPITQAEFFNLSKRRIAELKHYLSGVPAIPFVPNITTKTQDSVVIEICDWHSGRKTKGENGVEVFNDEILRDRINKFLSALNCLLKNWIIRGGDISEIVILSVGDLVDGAGIYAGQELQSTMAPPSQVMFVVDFLKRLILMLLGYNLPVRFEGVMGNHGEIRNARGKVVHPLNNWDFMIFLILDMWQKDTLQNEKFQLRYSELAYLNLQIQNWNYHIRHKAPAQPETPAGKAKFLGWYKEHKFNVFVTAHLHHWAAQSKNNLTFVRGGALTAADDLAESMAERDNPTQLVWRCTPKRPLTELYPVDLNVGT